MPDDIEPGGKRKMLPAGVANYYREGLIEATKLLRQAHKRIAQIHHAANSVHAVSRVWDCVVCEEIEQMARFLSLVKWTMPDNIERLVDERWGGRTREGLIEAIKLLKDHPISPEGQILLALVDAEECPDATPMQKWIQRKARFLGEVDDER